MDPRVREDDGVGMDPSVREDDGVGMDPRVREDDGVGMDPRVREDDGNRERGALDQTTQPTHTPRHSREGGNPF